MNFEHIENFEVESADSRRKRTRVKCFRYGLAGLNVCNFIVGIITMSLLIYGGIQFNHYSNEINSSIDKFQHFANNIHGVENDISNFKNKFDNIQNKFDNIQNEVSDFKNKFGDFRNKFDNLTDQMGYFKSAIFNISEVIDKFKDVDIDMWQQNIESIGIIQKQVKSYNTSITLILYYLEKWDKKISNLPTMGRFSNQV